MINTTSHTAMTLHNNYNLNHGNRKDEGLMELVQNVEKKSLLRNEKGLTLIELLAVIVILAIIAAIAIPSIGGIIAKTKKESHRANAQMIVDAARYKMTVEDFPVADSTGVTVASDGSSATITLGVIVSDGFLEGTPQDPQGSGTYNESNTVVTVTKLTNGSFGYAITLVGSGGTSYFTAVDEADIKTNEITQP